MFQVAISGSYGGLNLGDEAILQSIVTQLRNSLPVEITVFSRNGEDTLQRHQVERAVTIRDLTRDEARAEVERLDLLILGGGGILYDRDAEAYLREVLLAHEVGVPVLVYAISAGPLQTASARKAVREALNKVALITVRDRQGRQLLEEVGVTQEIQVTADPALLMEPEPLPEDALTREGLDAGHCLVGFSVREPGPAAPDIDVDHYHALLANAADFVVDRLDADVVFVPLERKKMDLQHSHAVIAQMQHPQRATVLKGEYTSRQIVSLIGRFEFSIGMRLHFLIFSALQSVPLVALPYASKIAGFIEDLEMEVPPLKNVNAGQLIAYIDRSWDYRDEIRERIRRLLPEIQARARQTNELAVRLLTERARWPVAQER
jgi:polysaccharide pyruvyl transferase CsaB